MTSADTKRWKVLFGKVCAMHGREWDDAQSRFYFDALKASDFRDVEAAGEELMQTLKFFPKPAEWRQAIGRRLYEARRAREREMSARRMTHEIHCERCRDTGMRETDTDPTRYTHCECKPTNPNYQIGRAQLRAGDDDAVLDLQPSADVVPDHEARRITGVVRDFRRASGDD